MITGRIKAMLEECEAGKPSFPPNVLFNESWLLRIVIDWFGRHGGTATRSRTCRVRAGFRRRGCLRRSCRGTEGTGSPRVALMPTA